MSVHGDRRRRVALTAIAGALVLATACGRRSTPGATLPPTSPAPTTVVAATTSSPPVTTTTPSTTLTVITTTTLDAAATKAVITTNWERFFLPTTSISDRMALLENGATLQQALEERSKDPLMQQASATVQNIELTAPDRATVTYDVMLNGTVALADSLGVAVRQDGEWKVSAESFCALISLGATGPIPGCG